MGSIFGLNQRFVEFIFFSIFSRISLTFLQRRRLPFVVRHLPHNFTSVALRLRATLWHSLLSQDLPLFLSSSLSEETRGQIRRKYVIVERCRETCRIASLILMGAFIETSFVCILGRLTGIA